MIGYVTYRLGYFATRTALRYEEALQINYQNKYGISELDDDPDKSPEAEKERTASAAGANDQSAAPEENGYANYKPSFRERVAAFGSAVWRAAVDTVEMHTTHSLTPTWVNLGDELGGRRPVQNQVSDKNAYGAARPKLDYDFADRDLEGEDGSLHDSKVNKETSRELQQNDGVAYASSIETNERQPVHREQPTTDTHIEVVWDNRSAGNSNTVAAAVGEFSAALDERSNERSR